MSLRKRTDDSSTGREKCSICGTQYAIFWLDGSETRHGQPLCAKHAEKLSSEERGMMSEYCPCPSCSGQSPVPEIIRGSATSVVEPSGMELHDWELDFQNEAGRYCAGISDAVCKQYAKTYTRSLTDGVPAPIPAKLGRSAKRLIESNLKAIYRKHTPADVAINAKRIRPKPSKGSRELSIRPSDLTHYDFPKPYAPADPNYEAELDTLYKRRLDEMREQENEMQQRAYERDLALWNTLSAEERQLMPRPKPPRLSRR
jgi:hypothetical protein